MSPPPLPGIRGFTITWYYSTVVYLIVVMMSLDGSFLLCLGYADGGSDCSVLSSSEESIADQAWVCIPRVSLWLVICYYSRGRTYVRVSRGHTVWPLSVYAHAVPIAPSPMARKGGVYYLGDPCMPFIPEMVRMGRTSALSNNRLGKRKPVVLGKRENQGTVSLTPAVLRWRSSCS